MQSEDLKLLNDIYIRMLKNGIHMYGKTENNMSIKSAQRLESYSTYLIEMNEKLKNILELTNKYANECLTKATEIRKIIDIDEKYEGDPSQMIKAHKLLYSSMSWGDIDEIEETREKIFSDITDTIEKNDIIKDYTQPQIIYKSLSNVYGKQLGFDWKVPIINKLNEMPTSLYWYKGDVNNPEGIYTCLTKGFYIQVPFPNVIDSTQNFNRTGSVKCKYNNINECLESRSNLASRYNSPIRECTFAHKGDRYVKLGTTFRSPNKPRFGNHHFLKNDMDNIPDDDIKTILMYALSDMLLSSMWFQRQKTEDSNKSIIMTNIDIC
jgi:hypothetical protein